MPHIVTQSCCSDASCVYACPVNCIHPTPDEPDFLNAEMLFIDPESCVDCGACAAACPVDAIVPHTKLQIGQEDYAQVNADYYQSPQVKERHRPLLAIPPITPKAEADRGPLRVAVVGSGPAAQYAADELLKQHKVQVNVFEKLPAPHGLVRYGVAPDHQTTKQVTHLFEQIAAQEGFEYFLGVEVGKDISHADLASHHHAVIYAVGASRDRNLGIPGEDLPGSVAATEFVAWYNGHPEYADRTFNLDHERVVIVGNGNVALDVARILTADPDKLAKTDIAPYALAALRQSKVREVVILGRRGPAQAAYTLPEFLGLMRKHDAELSVDKAELVVDAVTAEQRRDGSLDPAVATKLDLIEEIATHVPGTGRRIVFRFLASPTEIDGTDRAEGVSFTHNELVEVDGTLVARPTETVERLDAGLVLRSVGYRGRPLPGVPFDDKKSVIPNTGGRVLEQANGEQLPGVYVTGWIKRGPSGFIGTNKSCARETVDNLVTDFNAGKLSEPTQTQGGLRKLLRRQHLTVVDAKGWKRIDQAERQRGAEHGAVREKFTTLEAMADAAADHSPRRLLPWRKPT